MPNVVKFAPRSGTGVTVMPRTGASPQYATIRERLEERRQAKGMTGNQVARLAGLGATYYNDIIAGKSKNPRREDLAKVADVLGCDVGYLVGEVDEPAIRADYANPPGYAAVQKPSTVPLYSVSLPDPDGFFRLDESNKSTVHADAEFAAVPFAYAISVPDDETAPRFRAGEIVYIHPNKPVGAGSFAVICLNTNRVAIREIVRIDRDTVTFRALASGVEEQVQRSEVKTLHRAVGVMEH